MRRIRRHHCAFLLALALAGCAASAAPSAAVNVNALLPDHPLYGALAQYDRQIAIVKATLHTQFSDASAQAQNASAAVSRDMTAATNVTNALAAGRSHAAAAPDYASVLHAQAAHDEAQFISAVNARTARAYTDREQELRESELNLELELARKDAPKRLELRAQLQTLALTQHQRTFLQSQLALLQHREDGQLNALRSSDAHILESYRRKIDAQAQADATSMQSSIQSSVNAGIAAHQQAANTQMPALPSTSAYATARSELSGDFSEVAHANDADVAAARDELVTLQADRSALHAKMVAQIQAEADAISRSRGYSGARLNAAVARALRSLLR